MLFTVQSVLPEAAQKIGVSTDTLGNYERGKSYPDIPILRKIESVYGVPYDRLIFLSLDFGLTEKEQKNQNARAVKCKDQDNKTHQENSQQEGI